MTKKRGGNPFSIVLEWGDEVFILQTEVAEAAVTAIYRNNFHNTSLILSH